jgi:Mg2+ and Co2+ transporter CorA
MDYEDRVLACKKIHEKANSFRGLFLNRVAVIEEKISTMLTNMLPLEDKRRPFAKRPLEKKRQILFKKIQDDYSWYWNENKRHLEPLEEIIKFRNKLAHSVLDVTEQTLERPIADGVGFAGWERGKPVTDAYFNETIVKTTMIISCLSDIGKFLPS